MRFKRVNTSTHQHSGSEEIEESTRRDVQTQTTASDILKLIPDVIDRLRILDRLDDFVSILSSINEGHLDTNIAFHLHLDVGTFFS